MLAFVRLYLISQTWILATLFFLMFMGVPLLSGCCLISSAAAPPYENYPDDSLRVAAPPQPPAKVGVPGTTACSPSVSSLLLFIGLVAALFSV